MPTVITVSRQLGAGASDILREVASRLGYTVVDSALLHAAPELAHIPQPAVPDDQERGPSVLERLHLNPEVGRYLHALDTVFHRYAVAQGRVILIGHGSQVFLRKQDKVLHLRIIAPINERIARVEGREMQTHAEAEQHVHASDRQRAAFYRFFLKTDWEDPLLYHIAINTGRVKHEEAAGLIVSQMQAPVLALPIAPATGRGDCRRPGPATHRT